MPRKVVQGPIRDKERTKQKLLNAVGKILKTEGYLGLKVSKISAVAGFDKKLIYTYFGSTDMVVYKFIQIVLMYSYHSNSWQPNLVFLWVRLSKCNTHIFTKTSFHFLRFFFIH